MENSKKDTKETNTEQLILQCAEEVFIERGFDGAKTTEIARRAGVNHAMLHYYFRTKKNLFNVVFQDKLALIATSFSDSLSQDLPFFDKIRAAVETHFDFIAKNPKLLFFIYTEVVNSDERKMLLIKNVLPKAQVLLNSLEKGIEEEVAKGTIRSIKAFEVILNIIALNVTTFLASPLMDILIGDEDKIAQLMAERKENNVEFIINGMKINSPKPMYTQTSLNFDM